MATVGTNKSEIAPLAVIRHNVIIDTREVRRRQNRKSQNAALSNNVDSPGWADLCHGNILFSRAMVSDTAVAENARGRMYAESITNCVPVMAAFNGAGKEGDSVEDLFREYNYRGICATQAKLNMQGGLQPDTCPADLQGLITVINNGRSVIHGGQFIKYSLARSPEEARRKEVVNDGCPPGRVLAYYEPYDPVKEAWSYERMVALRNAVARPIPVTDPTYDPCTTDYRQLISCVAQIMLLGAATAKVAMDPVTQRFDRIITPVAVYNAVDKELIGKFNVKGGEAYPARSVQNTISIVANSLLAFMVGADSMADPQADGGPTVNEILKNCMRHFFISFKRIEWTISSRVIGVALSSAAVGNRFDLFLTCPQK